MYEFPNLGNINCNNRYSEQLNDSNIREPLQEIDIQSINQPFIPINWVSKNYPFKIKLNDSGTVIIRKTDYNPTIEENNSIQVKINYDSGLTTFHPFMNEYMAKLEQRREKLRNATKRRILHDKIYEQNVTMIIRNLEVKITNFQKYYCRSKLDVIFLVVEYIKYLKNTIKTKCDKLYLNYEQLSEKREQDYFTIIKSNGCKKNLYLELNYINAPLSTLKFSENSNENNNSFKFFEELANKKDKFKQNKKSTEKIIISDGFNNSSGFSETLFDSNKSQNLLDMSNYNQILNDYDGNINLWDSMFLPLDPIDSLQNPNFENYFTDLY
ncbi:hypothetical protein HZS_4017 [Henneguya salminicola]|nr:hypothetical protein HZS_4017 [Henneguya salminicola]